MQRLTTVAPPTFFCGNIAGRMTVPIITPSMKLIPPYRLLFQVRTVYTRKKWTVLKKKLVIGPVQAKVLFDM